VAVAAEVEEEVRRGPALLLAAALGLAACSHSSHPAAKSTTSSSAPAKPKRGGSVRVGVWGMPDVAAPTLAGAAVRALVLPQLFVAGPDGKWRPSLVQPGSDKAAADGLSASFKLRPGAAWSNGSPITADDLRRSMDKRFVAAVDAADSAGRITVHFTQKVAGWQRLWSGVDSVAAPGPGVWGGPFVVAASTPGLETVLRRNDSWWGAPAPNLDEVRLVLVPDSIMERQLFEQGQLDVVSPPAYTVRRQQYGAGAAGAAGAAATGPSGWDVRLVLNPARLDEPTRKAVVATVERKLFVQTLLENEGSLLNGWAGQDDVSWAKVIAAAADTSALNGRTVQLTGEVEEPMTALLERAMQKRVTSAGGSLELRNAEADRVEGWLASGDYAAAVAMSYEGPSVCWTCRWQSVDAAGAAAADSGDASAVSALEAKLRDGAYVLPLWRMTPFTAARPGVLGVAANGLALGPAWNAWEWSRR
jgi:hypothetical protein